MGKNGKSSAESRFTLAGTSGQVCGLAETGGGAPPVVA